MWRQVTFSHFLTNFVFYLLFFIEAKRGHWKTYYYLVTEHNFSVSGSGERDVETICLGEYVNTRLAILQASNKTLMKMSIFIFVWNENSWKTIKIREQLLLSPSHVTSYHGPSIVRSDRQVEILKQYKIDKWCGAAKMDLHHIISSPFKCEIRQCCKKMS